MNLDGAGKASFDAIYVQPDPRAYFSTLRRFDYCIPQLAKPYFARLVDDYREAHRGAAPRILDIGCSYGINAALLKYDVTMDELYERYSCPQARTWTGDALLGRDRDLVRSRDRVRDVRFVGLDASRPALAYGQSAGFLDETVHADLETRDPTPEQRRKLAGVDIVISTGCLGYVTERTIERIAAAQGGERPWMAHFVLRMFSFERVAECLARRGYETARPDGLFRQRRFASAEEKARTLDTLAAAGVDPANREADGWLYAQLYLSRPRPAPDRGRPPHADRPVVARVANIA